LGLSFEVQRAVLSVALGLACAATASARVRGALLAHPVRVLAALVVADAALLVWSATPFVPLGVDESYFAINAQVLRGAPLVVSWFRTPLPIVAAAATPWQPLLVGIVLKEVAVAAAYLLARRTGPAVGLLAALWTATAFHLARHCSFLLAEPYGAAWLSLFPLCAVRGPWWLAAADAGLAMASRWQLGVLVPCALAVAFTRGPRWRGAACALVLAVLPVALLAPLTGLDPLAAAQFQWTRDVTVWDRLSVYLAPKSWFGLRCGVLLAVIGIWRALQARSAERAWVAALFVGHAAVVCAFGIADTRFFAPAIPLGAVLMALGFAWLVERLPRRGRASIAGVLLAAVTLAMALPIPAFGTRQKKLGSPQASLVAARADIDRIVGDATLCTDLDVLVVTAALGHPCRAVLGPTSRQPAGIDLTFEGTQPPVERCDLARGSLYLTFAPEQRVPLWRGGGLTLVRW
jgi:hypothetical protein